MKPERDFELKILQCDGSIKIYRERPWWLDLPIQGVFPHGPHEQKKAAKISKTMSDIAEINRQTYLDSLLKIGVVRRNKEMGVVTIRDVADKVVRY